jgi:uncharacterized membrane protein YcaP (DUF421 family)
MEIMARATAVYFFLWLLTRGLGKRVLSEMTAFEMILLVTIGDLIQQGVTQEDYSVTGAFLAVGTIGAWILLFSVLDFRSDRARVLIDGMPVVVVKDGHPLEDVLAYERVPLEDVLAEARNQGISNLRDVRLAVLEPDGKFSFILAGPPPHQQQAAASGDGPKP